MNVAFTGPRTGISAWQISQLTIELHRAGATCLHHGDCKGGDEQAHAVGRRLGLWIIGHPPIATGLRAYCECDELREQDEYVLRDRVMVRQTDLLIAAPNIPEIRRSGTWTTIRYAKQVGGPLIILNPDETVTRRGARTDQLF